MKKAITFSGLAIVLGWVAGCGGQVGSWTNQIAKALKTAEEVAVLAFCNDQPNVTVEVLDQDCSIRSDSARNIIAHRDGQDGVAGTADDNLFGDIEELDGVSMVGNWTIKRLTTCADSFGYLPTKDELALLNFLNDSPHTSFERLDMDCGLRSDTARNLIVHRDGQDGIDGTADDNPFHSVSEVDSVYRVGEATIAQLQGCAEAYGYDKKGHQPPALLSTGEALEIAKECIVTFIQEDRMHREDWHAQLSYATTWESAVAAGIMDGINRFGDSNYCVDTTIDDEGTFYAFFGKSAFDLWTDVHVDKATGECIYIYIEID